MTLVSLSDKVRIAFDRLTDGDVETIVSFSHEDVEFVPLLTGHAGEPYKGHDGLREWHRDMEAVFERLASHLFSVTEYGDVVIAEGELIVIGTGDTPTVNQQVAWLVWTRDGKATRIEVLASGEEARVRAGLD
jgi:ketosteroid isomerase-like protein